jgi:hypothetical protein
MPRWLRRARCVPGLVSLGISLAHSLGCRAPPTQVTLLLDSDADPARSMSLAIVMLEGPAPVDALRAALPSATQLTNDTRALFAQSVALVPRAAGPRTGVRSVLAVLELAAQGATPASRIERWQTVTMLERVPQQGRMFFNLRCAARTTGCTSVPADACTLSARCIERGLTCGDEGACVDLALPTVIALPEAPREAGAPAEPDATADARCPAGAHRIGEVCIRDGGVRPIAPLSLGDTTLRRPTLRFALPDGADGAVVELCRDRACAIVIETLRVPGSSARPTMDLPAASVVFWRARARVGAMEDSPARHGPTWLFHTPARDNPRGVDTSAHPHTDINGDGFDDVVIGAPFASPSGRTNAGAARVFHGGPMGLSAVAAQTLEGRSEREGFGRSVASAGDVNGDGFGDLIVGAPFAPRGAEGDIGVARVFHGGASGIASIPAQTFEGATAGDTLGMSVASAGDVNADGYADVIIGAPVFISAPTSRRGTAQLLLGTATGIDPRSGRSLQGSSQGDRFGVSVASAGDINGDGFSDVMIGGPQGVIDRLGRVGIARVLLGGPTAVSAEITLGGSIEGDAFGGSVASAGDVNGDGYSDVIVAAYHPFTAGRVRAGAVSVFLGSPTGPSTSAARTLRGAMSGDAFGYAVSCAGDLDRDGFSDVIVGAVNAAPGGRMSAGTASVFLGSATGIADSPAQMFEGMSTGDAFGGSIAGGGDLDRDGFADVIVGAASGSPGGRMRAGLARVLRGSARGLIEQPGPPLEGITPGDAFGWSIACAGDLRGDVRAPRRASAPSCRSGAPRRESTGG